MSYWESEMSDANRFNHEEYLDMMKDFAEVYIESY